MDVEMRSRVYALELLNTQLISEYLVNASLVLADLLRRKLAREPSIRGGKKAKAGGN